MTDEVSWIKWHFAKWRADPALRMCSLSARGLWIELLAVMHECEPYGHLMINGKAPTPRQIASIVGMTTEKEVSEALSELMDNGVCSLTDKGAIYSRRMVRDKATRETASAYGREGGNPALRKRHNPTDHRGVKGGVEKPLKPEKEKEREEEKKDSSSLRSDAPTVDEKQIEPFTATEPATNSQPHPNIPSPVSRAGPLLPLGLPEIRVPGAVGDGGGCDDTPSTAEAAHGQKNGVSVDARTELFGAGLRSLCGLTGKGENAARALLGKLLREARDDPHAVLAVLGDAGRLRPADTVPWLMAAVRARASPGAPPGKHDRWGLEAWIARQPDIEIKQLAEGSDETGPSINGYWLRWAAGVIAEAADLPDSWRGSWDPLGEWCRCEIDVDGGVVARVVARLDGPVRSLRVFTEELYAAALGRWQTHWRGMGDAGDRFRPRLPERIAA